MEPDFNGCPTGKRIHYTRALAKKWIRSRQGIHHKKRVRIYVCEQCGFYHATSYGSRETASIREFKKKGRDE